MRVDRHLSQREMAGHLGVSPLYLNDVEQGRRVDEALVRRATAYYKQIAVRAPQPGSPEHGPSNA